MDYAASTLSHKSPVSHDVSALQSSEDVLVGI